MTHSTLRPRLLWTWHEAYAESEPLRAALESFAEVEVRGGDRTDLEPIVGDCEILVPRLNQEVNEAVLAAARSLRMIGTPSTGSDHIAVAAAERRGIRVVTIKDDRAFLDTVQATAELAWLLILACNRRMREALSQVERGEWNAHAVRGHELIGRTLGIVGYGRLGTMVSRFAHAFGMNVIAADPHAPIPDPWVTRLELHELLARADIVSLHVHLNDGTRGLIGREALRHVKRGAVLVNTSRGGVIDEDALIEALQDGRLSAAGLDVIEGERDPNRTRRPLMRYAAAHPHLIITPHVGGCTLESQHKAFIHFAHKLSNEWQRLHPPL